MPAAIEGTSTPNEPIAETELRLFAGASVLEASLGIAMVLLEHDDRIRVVEAVRNRMFPAHATQVETSSYEGLPIYLDELDIATAALALWVNEGASTDRDLYLAGWMRRSGHSA